MPLSYIKIMKIWDYKSKKIDGLAIQVEKNPDIVMTNPEMAKVLISTVPLKIGDVVMEPCLGSGSFLNNLPPFTTNLWCEINKGRDYLSQSQIVDYTISNPPFVPRKLFWQFHQKAMETTRKEIYWLINLSALNVFTTKRLDEMKEKGWFINSFFIVADRRWFGRYAFVKFSKNDTGTFGWSRTNF
jgi:hypothetical protein